MTITEDALAWTQKEFADEERARNEAEKANEERATRESIERGKQAMAALQAADATIQAAALAARVTAAREAEENKRKQALFDAIYAVAAADGAISDSERDKLAVGLSGFLGDGFNAGAMQQSLENGRALFDEKGLKGTAADVAERITDEGERRCVLAIASMVAWLGGGVGTKEGLALQALTSAFGLPINKLHEIMGAAAKVAKG